MQSPFCCPETYESSYETGWGRSHFEAVAFIRPDCPHITRAKDFDAKLKRFHPDLNLGFDVRKGRYIIFRWTPQSVRLKVQAGPQMSHVHRFLDIIFELKWALLTRTKYEGTQTSYHFRDFGDWVFRHLRAFKPKQFEMDGSWIGPEIDAMHRANEARAKQTYVGKVEAIVNDCMSIADKGNPNFVRTAVRVPKKDYEKGAVPA